MLKGGGDWIDWRQSGSGEGTFVTKSFLFIMKSCFFSPFIEDLYLFEFERQEICFCKKSILPVYFLSVSKIYTAIHQCPYDAERGKNWYVTDQLVKATPKITKKRNWIIIPAKRNTKKTIKGNLSLVATSFLIKIWNSLCNSFLLMTSSEQF